MRTDCRVRQGVRIPVDFSTGRRVVATVEGRLSRQLPGKEAGIYGGRGFGHYPSDRRQGGGGYAARCTLYARDDAMCVWA